MVGIIRLGSDPSGFASIGSQLDFLETLSPFDPRRILGSPKLTGALAGSLFSPFGAAVGALGGFIAGGSIEGFIQASPKGEKFIKERFTDPEKGGEIFGGFVEDPKGFIGNIFDSGKETGEKAKDKVGDVATAIEEAVVGVGSSVGRSAQDVGTGISEAVQDVGLTGRDVLAGVGGALAGLGIVEAIRGVRSVLEEQQQAPTLTPDLPEVPTPIGAFPQVVTPSQQQPINIDIDIKPRKNEVLINNIIQNI